MDPKEQRADDAAVDRDSEKEEIKQNAHAESKLETADSSLPAGPEQETAASEQVSSVSRTSTAADQNTQSTRSVQTVAVKQKRFKKMLLYIAGGVFGLFALVIVTGFIQKEDRVGTLISAQAKGVQFMRPEKWVENTSQDGFTYYTENGSSIENAELAVVLGTQTAPVDYTSLSEADKTRVKGAFTAKPEALSSSFSNQDCVEPGEVKNNEQQREGYDLAYLIEATCNKLKGRDTSGKVKVVFGWKGKSLQIFAVIADDELWRQNEQKLNEILTSAKPQ